MAITNFTDDYYFLSNFGPIPVQWAGHTWPTSEHAYQAAKTLNEDERLHILSQSTPGKAKRAGRKVTIRPDWEEVKVATMLEIVTAKFTQNRHARNRLVGTGSQKLVEGNYWGDTFWGVCNGVGQNHLGKVLMQVREALADGRS